MSWEALKWAFTADLPSAEKCVLLCLANRHNQETGRCDPSFATLADDAGTSRRSVIRAVTALKLAGYLTAIVRPNTSDFFHLKMDQPMPPAMEKRKRRPSASVSPVTNKHVASDTLTLGVVTNKHVASDTLTPKPGSNQEVESRKEPSTSRKAAPREVDPRFSKFRSSFENYFRHKTPGVQAPWDAQEAANLSRWLRANPTVTCHQWQQILNNRARSDVPHSIPLSQWIKRALAFVNGTANDFGKPGGQNARNQNRAETATISALQAGRNAIARIDEMYGPGTDRTSGHDGRAV